MDRTGEIVSQDSTRQPEMVVSERRAFSRVPVRLEIGYEDSYSQVFLTACDVSEGGMYLYSIDPPAPGSIARLLFEIPNHPAMIRVGGVVAHSEHGPNSGFGLRFEPEKMPPVDYEALCKFVAMANAPSPRESSEG
ncbi:MAG: PilZ domain-containing protein [Deltaproteobacteria bacterium]|nr:PilZ domain-containing protein [Deltaproteobacteria bacterium]